MIDWTRWPEADELLDRALAMPAEARLAFVREAASANPDLRAALEAAITEAANGDGFLEPGGALSVLTDVLRREPVDTADPDEAPLTLKPGAWIEHYEITGILGRGGMGEVYRARDTRLQRDVAVKVLPARFASDPSRVARFRREARLLASLSHPGIGAIYGVAQDGREGGIEALILEYVEGPTLAERIAASALPIDEVIAIGQRLAEALESAHARGILHRDLKPANIKIVEGGVKILDFGLAKALAPEGQPAGTDLTGQSRGILLGTAAYTSPEQIRGQTADARADIWAFGCVLFEAITGVRAFSGRSVAETLARILEREPAFGLLPPSTPAPIRRLLRRTLEKNPQRRLGYIGDAILEFDEATTPSVDPAPPQRSLWLPLLLLGLGVAAGVAGAGWFARLSTPASSALSRFVIPLPAGEVPIVGFQPVVALSPDGRTLVYQARRNGVIQLFRRDLEDLEARSIAGTENATGPFFSPDGRWLGFDGDGVLKRVPLAGGAPVVICPAPGGATATWVPDDTIVFATNAGRVLQRVPVSGGTPVALTALDQGRGDTLHLLPQALQDGKTVLFTIASGRGRLLAAIHLDSGEIRIIGNGTHARTFQDDLIVFWRDGSLWGSKFDAENPALIGQAVPVLEGIEKTDNTVLHYDIAHDGSLAYLPAGSGDSAPQRLIWVDREGRQTPLGLPSRRYQRVGLSPDGTRIALAVNEDNNTDIWIADLRRETMTRLTFEQAIDTMPAWSPDGRSVAFRSEQQGPGIFRRDAQAAGPVERLTETSGPTHSPYSWTPDGKTLLFGVFRGVRSQAIAEVTPPSREIQVLLDGDYAQLNPQVSSNGLWLTYQSDESGRFEIYVRPYPQLKSARWQISSSGGSSPRWSRDGRELFYLEGSRMMSVTLREQAAAFQAGTPRPLFTAPTSNGPLGDDYDVTPDGRFLFIADVEASMARPTELRLVQNWGSGLRAKLAAPR
jgi:eukaryotic-like serine/threonine-protein kinase